MLLLEILFKIPLWAWLIFAYLMMVGIKATKNRVVYVPQSLVIPVALNYKLFMLGDLKLYLIILTVGSIIGFIAARKLVIKVLKDSLSVVVAGEYTSMIILIVFFLIKCGLGYARAEHLNLAFDLALIDLMVSSLFSGYFLGRSLQYFYQLFVKTA